MAKRSVISLFIFLIVSVYCETKTDMTGHLQQFGFHKTPDIKIMKISNMPTPEEFHREFVIPENPVVFVGAARHSAAHWFWTRRYLIENYGNLIVRLEGKFEGHGKMPSSEFGYGRNSIRNVLSESNGNSYIISQVPEPMEKDISIPPCLGCGFLEDGLQEVHLFITGRGGKTLIHRDPYSNIHCLFNGTKDWLLIHKNQTKNIYQSKSSLHEFGGFSEVDVDSVDLKKYPKVADIKFGKVTLNKGDCIYVPAEYWHQVRVNGEYNTAVSIWFTRNFKFMQHDWSKCPKKWEEPLDYKPMSEVDFLWRFSGKNEDLTQGHMDVHLLRELMLSYAKNTSKINLREFCDYFFRYENRKNAFMTSLSADENGFVDKNQIKFLSKHELKKSLVVIDPPDPSNTRWFEYSEIDKENVLSVLTRLIKNGSVEKHTFVNEYKKLGGTSVAGNEIFDGFALGSSHIELSEPEVKERAEKVLYKFDEASSHDPTLERKWHKHLRKRDEL